MLSRNPEPNWKVFWIGPGMRQILHSACPSSNLWILGWIEQYELQEMWSCVTANFVAAFKSFHAPSHILFCLSLLHSLMRTQISHTLSLWFWLSKHWGLSPTGVEVLSHVRYTANRNATLWSPSLCKTRCLEYTLWIISTVTFQPRILETLLLCEHSKFLSLPNYQQFFREDVDALSILHTSHAAALTLYAAAWPPLWTHNLWLPRCMQAQAHKCLEEAEMGTVCILRKLILHHLYINCFNTF